MIAPNWKRFVFKRGYMPSGDFHDLFDRVKGRMNEIVDPKGMPPISPIRTILGGEETELDKEQQMAARLAWRKTAGERFIKIFSEEGEAQWDRIIDRRMSDWFYSAIISGILGFILGPFFLMEIIK